MPEIIARLTFDSPIPVAGASIGTAPGPLHKIDLRRLMIAENGPSKVEDGHPAEPPPPGYRIAAIWPHSDGDICVRDQWGNVVTMPVRAMGWVIVSAVNVWPADSRGPAVFTVAEPWP